MPARAAAAAMGKGKAACAGSHRHSAVRHKERSKVLGIRQAWMGSVGIVAVEFGEWMSFEIAPSRILRGLLWGLHGLAWLAIGLAVLPLAVQGVAAVLVGISLFRWAPPLACRLRTDREGVLHYSAGLASDAPWVACRVDGASHVTPLYCSLILRPQGTGSALSGPLRVLILPDSLPGEDFRRLRVWLRRWGAHAH